MCKESLGSAQRACQILSGSPGSFPMLAHVDCVAFKIGSHR